VFPDHCCVPCCCHLLPCFHRPVVITLLNSYSGYALCAEGFMLVSEAGIQVSEAGIQAGIQV
jgi:hypothetical protein